MLVVKINYERTVRHFSVRGERDESIKQRRPAAKTRPTHVRKRSSVTAQLITKTLERIAEEIIQHENLVSFKCRAERRMGLEHGSSKHARIDQPASQPVRPILSHPISTQLSNTKTLSASNAAPIEKWDSNTDHPNPRGSTNPAASQVHPIPSQRPISTQ